jgi:RNA polymerase sigma factor (sigma-70 family)
MARLAGLLVGHFQAGEEIAQDAFARLAERWHQVDSPPAYLRTTVVNLSRSRIRRAVLTRRYPLQSELMVPGPEESIATVLAHEPIQAALARLPRRQREVVVLRYYEGLSDAQVARALGISVSAVKSHLRRATVALSKDLEELR